MSCYGSTPMYILGPLNEISEIKKIIALNWKGEVSEAYRRGWRYESWEVCLIKGNIYIYTYI